ncbi:calcium-binding protein [Streptomyces sp. NPDC003077]|uniref:calcium-binding protein n=1 Tax=Streptomyces sp. NPDC003077 TaxID=3154443 RepID=UPI0033BAC11E
MSVNGGKDIVVGAGKASVKVSFKATDRSGIFRDPDGAGLVLWNGPAFLKAQAVAVGKVKCSYARTSANCTATVEFKPGSLSLWKNELAGQWKVHAWAVGADGDIFQRDVVAKVNVRRAASLSVADVTPEPAKKNKDVTVTGSLKRADWVRSNYGAYGKQNVTLQFRKKGARNFTNVKTVKSAANGSLKTTVKASASGDYRWTVAATGTTAGATSKTDFVEVR